MAEDIKVAICVPSTGTCRSLFAHSLAGLIGYSGSLAMRRDAGSIALRLFLQVSSVIIQNRESLANEALAWDATHILFLDDDMQFDPRVLAFLLGRRQAIVSCNYTKRGFPITFTAIRPDGTLAIVTDKDATGLEECLYTGFGVSLIEAAVFRKTRKPWFMPLYLPEADMYTTEDNPFFQRARQEGFRAFVDHDASKLVAHVGDHVYSWQQWQPAPPEKPKAEVVELPREAKA